MRKRLDDDVDGLARKRALERRRLALRSPVKTRSAATPSSSQRRRSIPLRACAARSTVASLSGAVRWIGDERGDEDGRHDASRRAGKHVRRALLIAGPTASGKSAAALALAQAFGATIVNADSMQVYRDLRILTARPTPDEERLAPHRLFGSIDGAVNFSAGRWALGAGEVLAEIGERPVIFVGGTGLYFRALTEGLSDIPPVPEAVRAEVRSQGGRSRRNRASRRASGARSRDRRTPQSQRPAAHLARARGARRYGASARLVPRRPSGAGVSPGEWAGLYLAPDRAELGQRIDARFDAMLAQRRARRGRDLDATAARSGAAGDARARRSASHRPSRGPALARRGRVTLEARHPPLRQAAVHLGAPPALGLPIGGAGGGGRGGGEGVRMTGASIVWQIGIPWTRTGSFD